MANFNLNKVILGGRLTANPELRQTPSGVMVLTFGIAVNRNYRSRNEDGSMGQPQADFINCVAWRERAELYPSISTKVRLSALSVQFRHAPTMTSRATSVTLLMSLWTTPILSTRRARTWALSRPHRRIYAVRIRRRALFDTTSRTGSGAPERSGAPVRGAERRRRAPVLINTKEVS